MGAGRLTLAGAVSLALCLQGCMAVTAPSHIYVYQDPAKPVSSTVEAHCYANEVLSNGQMCEQRSALPKDYKPTLKVLCAEGNKKDAFGQCYRDEAALTDTSNIGLILAAPFLLVASVIISPFLYFATRN